MARGRYSIAAICLGALLVADATAGAAQTMFKCVDGRGGITYSNVACEKQGLKDAGPVADRTTTLSFPPLPNTPPPRERPPGGDAAAKGEPAAGGAPAQVKPVNPLIEPLLK